MQENFKNLLLENQSALIYFNTGIRKLRGTLSYVTFESIMWEIRFRRRRQNFGVVWWCQEDTASFALLQLNHCVIATDKGRDSETESENLISFQPQLPTPSLLLSAQLKECQRDGVKHTPTRQRWRMLVCYRDYTESKGNNRGVYVRH